MTFGEYWRKFKKLTGVSGAYEMQLSYWQWLFEQGKITLEERNLQFDYVYAKARY
jgi:hypothetical protein